MDVVPGEEYPHYSSAPARCAEHHSQHKVQRNTGQDRLEAERQEINNCYGPLDMDLFASRLSSQCPLYFSWRPDPYAQTTDAFLQDWTAMKCYANPPWNLVGRVLAQVQSQQVQVVLIARHNHGLSMLIDHPRLIIPNPRKQISRDMPLLP